MTATGQIGERLQAHSFRRVLLARQRAEATAAAHLWHRLGERSGACHAIWPRSRRPRNATTVSSGVRWIFSTSRKRAPASSSGIQKAGSSSRSLINYMRRRQNAVGYREVNGPQLLDKSLWETSGHWRDLS